MKPTNYHVKSKYSLALHLFEAVEEQNLQDVITLLESENADPNLVLLDKGISPFHLVIGCESYQFAEEATRVFLQYNGNPNIQSEDGLTPLHVAAVWGRTELLLLLLQCGGDPWLRDCEASLTPLHLALKEKHYETALVLQRYQLLGRRNRKKDTKVAPRYNISLESVIVNAGDMQVEYGTNQDNVSPVMMSPVQEPLKKPYSCKWNIEPLQSQEYVRQWCDQEFSVNPVTSTPTRLYPPTPFNLTNGKITSFKNSSPKSDNYCSNILSSNIMTPSDKCGAALTSPVVVSPQKSFVKNSGDARKKLFLEFKKRFSGWKHSVDSCKSNAGETKDCSSKSARNYFGWKKKKVVENKNIDDQTEKKEDYNLSNLSLLQSKENFDPTCCSVPSYFNFKANVDEVDAAPFCDQGDLSMEWVASQSCFSEHVSPNSSNSLLYVTCDETPVTDKNSAEIRSDTPSSFAICGNVLNSAPEETVFKVPERPPRRKQLANQNTFPVKTVSNSETYLVPAVGAIVSEEYRYKDDEAGVVLLENHVLPKPVDMPFVSDSGSIVSVPISGTSDPTTVISDVSSIPASFSYSSEVLRKKLTAFGEMVGPITSTTKQVYLRRLCKLQKGILEPCKVSISPHSPELHKLLSNVNWEEELKTYFKLEDTMCVPFQNPDPCRRWREGVSKSSFNYLLLDPRISLNLPANVHDYDKSSWQQFISSIFYVGKGKRSRPYSHLYEAARLWKKGAVLPSSSHKIKRIHEIWNAGYGVVCLHIFLNTIPVEAFTREAAMIEALGMSNLCNLKAGEYYGPAATWRTYQKRQLGCCLLYRAMRVFLSEGERQLRPGDIE